MKHCLAARFAEKLPWALVGFLVSKGVCCFRYIRYVSAPLFGIRLEGLHLTPGGSHEPLPIQLSFFQSHSKLIRSKITRNIYIDMGTQTMLDIVPYHCHSFLGRHAPAPAHDEEALAAFQALGDTGSVA